MMSHPGQRITIFKIVSIITKAFNRTANIEKATNGFRSAGIYSFDAGKFDELFIKPTQPIVKESATDFSQTVTSTPQNPNSQHNVTANNIEISHIESTSKQDQNNCFEYRLYFVIVNT